MFGLYLHIPFCRSRCTYCGFNSYAGLEERYTSYFEALLTEIEYQSSTEDWPVVSSVFFGGGNPAILGGKRLSLLLGALRKNFRLSPTAEVTTELNPEDATPELLKSLKSAGFNRLSLGWQSLNSDRLVSLKRRHNRQQAIVSLTAARGAGFDNVNIDMIFGLPNQTITEWRDDLATLASLNPDHLSLYSLSLEPGTELLRQVEAGKTELPPVDDVAHMYEIAIEVLRKSGFDHYEISNFAKDGHACSHNLNCWHGGEYLGIGAGAHSHLKGKRSWRVNDPIEYIVRSRENDTIVGNEVLDKGRKLGERIILGLRLCDGIDIGELEAEYGVNISDIYGDAIRDLKQKGLLGAGSRLALTEKGLLLANEAMVAFV